MITTIGKTERCLNKFNLNNDIIGTHTSSGWTDDEIMKKCLDNIYNETQGAKSYLLLDQYTSHITDNFKKHAKEKNINLIYVPIGLTYKYQPLDVSINGILKSKGRALWIQEIIDNPYVNITRSDSIKHFLKAVNELQKNHIKDSFLKAIIWHLK